MQSAAVIVSKVPILKPLQKQDCSLHCGDRSVLHSFWSIAHGSYFYDQLSFLEQDLSPLSAPFKKREIRYWLPETGSKPMYDSQIYNT